MLRRPAPVAVLLCLAAALPASAVASAGLSWSAPVSVGPHAEPTGLNGVNCPTANECVAIDSTGHEVTFDPGSPQRATVSAVTTAALAAIACPSAIQCSAVDVNGNEVTFDPQSPRSPSRAKVDAVGIPLGLSCIASTQCTAVDASGYEVTFNPLSPSGASPVLADSGRVLVGVSCPSATECDAVDTVGSAVTFDPVTRQLTRSRTVEQNSPVAIDCPPGVCVVVDDAGGANTYSSTSQGSTTIDGNGANAVPLSGLSCVPAGSGETECAAVDVNGAEVSFDPQVLAANKPVTVDPGQALTGVSCPAASQCTAVDGVGHEVTFNPQSPGTPTPTVIDGHTILSAVSCGSSTSCTAVDLGGAEVTFSPSGSPAPAVAPIDPAAIGLYAISCPSSSQCTTVDNVGQEVTFNPASPGRPKPAAIDSGHGLLSVACPTATQCTAVDDRGAEVTFNPQAAGTPKPSVVEAGHGLPAVQCPSALQCTAIDDDGAAVTFDPLFPGEPTALGIDASPTVNLACPTTSQCTAIDTAGRQVTFFPQARSELRPMVIDANQLTAIACRTATDCVAVDAAGSAVEGDPRGSGAWVTQHIASAAATGIACPSARECVAIDAPGDSITATSGPLPPVPAALSRPSVSGILQRGKVLVATDGRWSGGVTSYAYAWERCNAAGTRCTVISTASGQDYTLGSRDVGHRIRVAVWAYNITGAGDPQISAATPVVLPAWVIRHASASGIAKGTPALSLTVAASGGMASLMTVQVAIPRGLSLAPGKAPSGLAVIAGRRGVKFTLRVTHGRLRVILDRAVSDATIRLTPPLLHASGGLVSRGRRHALRSLRLTVVVTQLRGLTTRLNLTIPAS